MTLPSPHRALLPAALALLLLTTLAAPGLTQEAEEPGQASETAPAVEAPAFDPGTRNPEAPDEVMLFGRLAGAWEVEQRIIGRDGKFPEEGTSALWTFQWIHDGRAIRDEWISPAPADPPGEDGRSYGTGLRVYNPEKGHWEMAWISTSDPFVTTYEARPDGDGGIVMLGTHPSGRYSRTTFFDVEADSFSWKLELQGLGENPEGWTEVARIRAVRRE